MSEGAIRAENNLTVASGKQTREGLCQGTELRLRCINHTTMKVIVKVKVPYIRKNTRVFHLRRPTAFQSLFKYHYTIRTTLFILQIIYHHKCPRVNLIINEASAQD
jgi:hypothetical protein